jgi:hypothetical protein
MTTLAPTGHRGTPPTELLTELRSVLPGADSDPHAVLDAWDLRPLTGGRNNHVYAWTGPGGEICIKLYRKNDERRRIEREWHALNTLAQHSTTTFTPTPLCTPTPLWRDEHPDQPAIGMSLVPGTPITNLPDIGPALKALAFATQAMQAVPLAGPLATLNRIDSAQHYLTRITQTWPQQLADVPDEPLTRDMLKLLHRWQQLGDADTLAHPAPQVFSRGDSNLLNWHHDGTNIYCVDFEFAGHSDVAFDAADHIEHISAREVPDQTWHILEADLGIDKHNQTRFQAARRTIALRWLAVLWKQRTRRATDFAAQLQRAKTLID